MSNTTTTKRKRETPARRQARLEVLAAALRYYDLEFWAERVTPSQAVRRLARVGVEARRGEPTRFAKQAKEPSLFWQNETAPPPPHNFSHTLSGDDWARHRRWLAERVIVGDDGVARHHLTRERLTIPIISAQLRRAGIPASRATAREACLAAGLVVPEHLPPFKEVTRG